MNSYLGRYSNFGVRRLTHLLCGFRQKRGLVQAGLFNQFLEIAIAALQQFERMPKFHNLASIDDQHPIVVHHRVQSMGYR